MIAKSMELLLAKLIVKSMEVPKLLVSKWIVKSMEVPKEVLYTRVHTEETVVSGGNEVD